MFIIEYLLLTIVVLSSVFGILFVLLQSSQSAKGLFEDGGSNLLVSQKGNLISRLTGILLGLFLLSNLSLAYIHHISQEPREYTPSFIKEERFSFDSNTKESDTKNVDKDNTSDTKESDTKNVDKDNTSDTKKSDTKNVDKDNTSDTKKSDIKKDKQ